MSEPITPEQRSDFQTRALAVFAAILVIVAAVLIFLLLSVLRGTEPEYRTVSGIRPVAIIDGPGVGEHPRFGRPMGVAFGEEGRVYVTDALYDRVCVFDKRGRFLMEFGGTGITKPMPGYPATWRPGRLNYPVGIDTSDEGTVYVADFKNDQIQSFSADGEYLGVFPDPHKPAGRGSSGQDGRGIAVTDVSVGDGEIYATDAYQVLAFGMDGVLKRQFGVPGRQKGGLDHPNGVSVHDGVVYVADSNHSRVQAFTQDGNLVWETGEPAQGLHPTSTADFTLPRGLTVLDDGRLLVTDAFQFSLVQVEADGKVTARYGDKGELPGQLMFPNDVDARGDLIAIADKDNRRVQLVRLVEETLP